MWNHEGKKREPLSYIYHLLAVRRVGGELEAYKVEEELQKSAIRGSCGEKPRRRPCTEPRREARGKSPSSEMLFWRPSSPPDQSQAITRVVSDSLIRCRSEENSKENSYLPESAPVDQLRLWPYPRHRSTLRHARYHPRTSPAAGVALFTHQAITQGACGTCGAKSTSRPSDPRQSAV